MSRADSSNAAVIRFEDEECHEVSSRFSLTESRVDVLAFAMPAFDKSELWAAFEKFHNFVRFDVMFSRQLLDDLVEPDQAGDLHLAAFCRKVRCAVERCRAEILRQDHESGQTLSRWQSPSRPFSRSPAARW